MSIQIRNITKTFGKFIALDDVNFSVEGGELVALLGPSGSGKTTLLRVIAGLEFADRGRILFGDREVTHQSAYQRRAGFVFQHYALFQHLNIFENIAFGLRVRKRRERPPEPKIRARVEQLLETALAKRLRPNSPAVSAPRKPPAVPTSGRSPADSRHGSTPIFQPFAQAIRWKTKAV
jgi:sulfate/thiosulfate transport system ATP-binding protein